MGASWVNAKVLSLYINEYELILFRNAFTIITLAPVLMIMKKHFYINKKKSIPSSYYSGINDSLFEMLFLRD